MILLAIFAYFFLAGLAAVGISIFIITFIAQNYRRRYGRRRYYEPDLSYYSRGFRRLQGRRYDR